MKPIIMSTEDVRALLDGRKTMVRMPIKPQPEFVQVHVWDGKVLYEGANRTWCWKQRVSPDCWNEIDWLEQFAPYQPGDVLWVRETWAGLNENEYLYQADGPDVNVWKIWRDKGVGAKYERWMSPITMPREAARLFLRVKDVRVERLQDIFASPPGPNSQVVKESFEFGCDFIAAWNNKNAKRGYGWDSNPYTWVIEFERAEKGAKS